MERMSALTMQEQGQEEVPGSLLTNCEDKEPFKQMAARDPMATVSAVFNCCKFIEADSKITLNI